MKNIAIINRSSWPHEALEPVPKCPICHSASRAKLYDNLVDDTFFTASGTWSMQQCTDCGSAYLDPRPTPESIGDAYASYYTHGSLSRPQGRAVKEAVKRVLQFLSGSYAASLANPERDNRSLSAMIGTVLVKALPPCREVVDARYRHLHRPEPNADRLLDIGCGGGEFLRRAQFLGWKTEGVDLDPKAVAAARSFGLNVNIGSIDSYANVREAFDVVTCNHVIEHVYDASHLVAAMHRILKPGGRLWVETPNINSAGHALFGKAWRGLEAPRHIAIFNYSALVRMLTNAGFLITHRTPWNIQHIRQMFSSSEAMKVQGDPHDCRTPLLPNRRLLTGLWLEALFVDRREFICLRAVKRP